MSNKIDQIASLLSEKSKEKVPSPDSVIDTLMQPINTVIQESVNMGIQESVNTEIQLVRKNKINARGKVKKTFELDADIEKRLRDMAHKYDTTTTNLLHNILDKALEK